MRCLTTTKLDVIHLPNRCGPNAAEDSVPEEISEELSGSPPRYNVCRENGSMCQKFVFNKKPASMSAQSEVEFEPEDDMHHHSLPQISNEEKGYRSFSVSTTQKNVILPLKSSKLANPFPDPVKVMPSHTVSDQEKAEQMQAEARVPRSITKTSRRI
ncbi:hypothetical protein JTB14_006122 [Gonioctena quinquepunctata]|nr:hypothetical protein JTB14_006122 [Gonioctena quinquepunctata]